MNLLDKFHFKDKNGIKTSMEICDSFSRSKIAEVVGMIPTKVSQLLNDSGFITSADVPTKTSELQNDSGFITSADVPTKTSELQNDSGFVNNSYVDNSVATRLPLTGGTLTGSLINSYGSNDYSITILNNLRSAWFGFANRNGYLYLWDATNSKQIMVSTVDGYNEFNGECVTPAIVSGGIVRTQMRTTDGIKYKYDSSQNRTLNITIPYGNGYLSDFRIDIPSNIQPPTNFYDVNITVACNGKIVFGAINYFNKNEIVGWVWSPTSDTNSNVYIQFSGYGY